MPRLVGKTIERTGGFLEASPYEADGGELIGRDPKFVPAEVFADAGIPLRPVFKAIRAHCLECSANASEVRKCVSFRCPLWPMRMGRLPSHLRAAMRLDKAPGDDNGDDEA